MNNNLERVSERQLPNWLLERIPSIRDSYPGAVEEHYGEREPASISAYFVFSFVLRPQIEKFLLSGGQKELKAIFESLEFLANRGDGSVQNELGVMMEELDVWKVWAFLGETMRRNEFDGVSWYPEMADRTTPTNTHVNKERYASRWREEIDRIGGFQNLNTENELYIRHLLVSEFGIIGMRAPEPGGDEWLSMKLRWPWPVG